MRAVQNIGKAGREVVHSVPRGFLTANEGGGATIDRTSMYQHLVQNDLLRRDEAREIDEAVTRVADRDRVGVSDLVNMGLVKNLRDIGVTLYQVDRHSAVEDAKQHMSITALGDRDQIVYTPTVYPVPVTSSQFQLDRRQIAAGQTQGQGVDVTNVEEHTRAVIRRLENTLANGNTGIVLDGNALEGYTNLTARQQVTFADVAWNDTADLTNAVTDTLAMRSALTDDGFDGPYVLYIPANYDGTLDDDYKAESNRTLRERLLAITGISDVKVLPSLSDDEVVLVQMTRSVVEYAVGQMLGPVTWDIMGGLARNWAILEVSTFAIKTAEDEDGTATSGVAHLTA